jgi:hypothetical protein
METLADLAEDSQNGLRAMPTSLEVLFCLFIYCSLR